jgi:hypothetical protein
MKKIALLATLLLTASCLPTIKNLDEYQKQFLNKTEFMPSKENFESKLPKVVVFALEENNNEVASNANLGLAIASNIENILTQNRLAELVDRKAAEKLHKEIALAEMNKTGSYKGPQIADYAVSGAISNADFASKYSSGSTYVDRNMNIITVPPKYTYSANASGNVKVYELPSLRVIEVIEFNAKKVRSENVQQNGGLSLGALQIGGEKVEGAKRDDGLVRQAGADAIDESKAAIKNVFAKQGYILEKRVKGKKAIFKISLGSSDAIKHGDEFEVIGQYQTQNPITGESETESKIITKGVITNQIDPKSSWVVIEDEDKANSIRLGDKVKLKYRKDRFSSFVKTAQNFAN